MPRGVSLRRVLAFLAVAVLTAALVPAACPAAPQPMPTNARIIFLHHSTGGVIWNGGVPGWFTTYNTTNGTAYAISQSDDPDGENNPYEYWNLWVNHAGPAAYLGQATLELLTPQYDVVVFKHCFPVCNIEADNGDPDVTSSVKTTENYKAQYEALKTKLRSFPANRFVLWTGAAKLAVNISPEMATRARTFFDWVRATWDEPGDNIYVWDFYGLETDGGMYLNPAYAASASDDHPSSAFGVQVAPLFCQRVVDVIQGSGDPPDTADVPDTGGLMLALAGANPTAGPVTLRLSLPEPAHVRLSIYDTTGRQVAQVTEGDFPAGQQVLTWDNRSQGVASGVYFARLQASGREVARRLVILD